MSTGDPYEILDVRGDAFATLKIVLPDKPDPDLKEFVSRWPAGTYDPRQLVGV